MYNSKLCLSKCTLSSVSGLYVVYQDKILLTTLKLLKKMVKLWPLMEFFFGFGVMMLIKLSLTFLLTISVMSNMIRNSQKLRVVSKTMCHELERAHINSSNMGNGAVSSDDTRKPFVYAVIRIVMGDVKNVAS